MKRGNYAIDGDIVVGSSWASNHRHLIFWQDVTKSSVLGESFFSWLPEEVMGLIASHILMSDPEDLQAFLRYLLPMFGVSLSMLRATYTECQQTILATMQSVLANSRPRLFEACLQERLGRISDCLSSMHQTVMRNVDGINSIKVVSSIPFLELFAFTHCRVCECCKEKFAYQRSIYVNIALCQECGRYLNFDDRVREKQKTPVSFVKCEPAYLYRWASEKLVRLWLGLSKDNPYMPSIFRLCTMGKKHTTFYLVKDVLPFVGPQYLVKPKPLCITLQ